MKSRFYLPTFLLLLSLTVFTPRTYASMIDSRPVKERVENMTDAEKKARLEEIKARINEIKRMDKSVLSKEERKALKKELKEMKTEAQAIRGIYLSVGAVIIIILLLILIL